MRALTPCDLTRLARAIYVTYNGALLGWAVLRTGALPRWLGRELDFLITPWRVVAPPPRSPRW